MNNFSLQNLHNGDHVNVYHENELLDRGVLLLNGYGVNGYSGVFASWDHNANYTDVNLGDQVLVNGNLYHTHYNGFNDFVSFVPSC
jgi:hypothetical protein